MKTTRILLIIAVIVAFSQCSYAGSNDKSDRLSNNQSNVFSPGYINAAKQKADAVINQLTPKKSFMDNVAEFVKDKLADKVSDDSQNKVVPELKRKTGAGQDAANNGSNNKGLESTTYSLVSPEGSVIVEPDYDFTFGSGIAWDKIGDRVVSEYVNGVKHIYAGFENYGFEYDGTTKAISDAISMSLPGDIIMVRGALNEEERYYFGDLTFSTNARIYGGYDESGQRDILSNVTAVIGNVTATDADVSGAPAEINGFWLADGGMTTSRPFYSLYNVYATYQTESYYTIATSNDFWINVEDSYGCLGNINIGGGVFYWGGKPDNLTVSNVGRTAETMFFTAGPSAEDITRYKQASESTLPYAKAYQYETNTAFSTGTAPNSAVTNAGLPAKEKDNLEDSESIVTNKGKEVEETLVEKALKDKLTEYVLASPLGLVKNINSEEGNVALLLDDLLKGLTGSEDIKKAADELCQKVAALLLMQAVPDLLKDSDIANMRDIFSELSRAKAAIIADYQLGTKYYYDEMKKLLSRNIALLQLNNIISKNMVEQELAKLEPSEIDKILEKLRKASNKSFEEDYILQQEAKYRKLYIEPNKKIFEDRMKDMMKDFTKRLSAILEGAKK